MGGRLVDVAEAEVARRKGKRTPLNIDGATAVIHGELGFPPPLTRGLFVLSRSVGILAHAWEPSQEPAGNEGRCRASGSRPTRGHRRASSERFSVARW